MNFTAPDGNVYAIPAGTPIPYSFSDPDAATQWAKDNGAAEPKVTKAIYDAALQHVTVQNPATMIHEAYQMNGNITNADVMTASVKTPDEYYAWVKANGLPL